VHELLDAGGIFLWAIEVYVWRS